ncbi:MAG: DUF309 domain-containing protein [Verrucomicrobiota bacterium]|nr:DUF309 domain-containing protein [Limisphaera sp.]MDW8381226.1 DUF309 domain-containing protein [Verrucomicrobiota bacterium]
MSLDKKTRVNELAQHFGQGRDARYWGYFACFNEQRFYEAHDVLESLWLERRKCAEANFYKGLIQLAGAFVHMQKGRLRPAAALLERATFYLQQYPEETEGLSLPEVLALAAQWLNDLRDGAYAVNPWGWRSPPRLPWPRPDSHTDAT